MSGSCSGQLGCCMYQTGKRISLWTDCACWYKTGQSQLWPHHWKSTIMHDITVSWRIKIFTASNQTRSKQYFIIFTNIVYRYILTWFHILKSLHFSVHNYYCYYWCMSVFHHQYHQEGRSVKPSGCLDPERLRTATRRYYWCIMLHGSILSSD